MRSDEIQKTIKKHLGDYRVKPISISGKSYDLYVFSEDEDLNLFEGFLFTEITEKSELSRLISRYRAPVSGYVPRFGFLSYKNQLIIKDYRKNRLIRKTLQKINKSFISKLKKSLTNPDESNFNKLFDRTDIIEEFWILYKKSREYLLENITGISEEDERIAFVDNLMMQMLTLWYLQEKRFFDGDTSYFIIKFTEMEQKKLFGGFKNYYEFLTHFFEIIGNNVGNQYYEDDFLAKVVVLGPAIFLNGNIDQAAITIPDRYFYKEGMTNTLINTPPKKVGADVPLFNLFESRDWTEGNIDDFVLGAIYEKLITHIERKKLGAYYTPEKITEYICKNTIEPYLTDRINEGMGGDFKSIDEIVESDDKEMLLRLFDSLKEIKILDPAVGSAHFLADAIEVLLDVYEKIWDRAKELGLRRGLEITAADERGRLKNINLLEISDRDRDQFKIYIKFFIILSKNIYGVDINQSAINVARARLFLSIAKHFDVGKGCFIRFPNVHFNLRTGNSLIGYVGMVADGGRKQSTFDMFVGEKEAVYAAEPIRVVSELGEYLSETARTLGMDGAILKKIGGLNGILSMERIGWDEFERVLRVKEKLIRILIVSLNSEHAMPLNGLIKSITALFGGKLDERFAREYGIDMDALEEIGTFHWGMEFPEVFLERGGFDVVVGNPPYVSAWAMEESNKTYREILPVLYSDKCGLKSHWDIYVPFILQAINIAKIGGYFSYILPNPICREKYATEIRRYVLENTTVAHLLAGGEQNLFVGVSRQSIVFVLKLVAPVNQENAIEIQFVDEKGEMKTINRIQQKVWYGLHQSQFRYECDNTTVEIIDRIRKTGIQLGNVYYVNYGAQVSSKKKGEFGKQYLLTKEPKEYPKKFFEGKDLSRFEIRYRGLKLDYIPQIMYGPRVPELFESPKLIVRHISGNNDTLISTVDYSGYYCDHGIILSTDYKNLKPEDRTEFKGYAIIEDHNYTPEFILCILNSKLLSFFYRNVYATGSLQGSYSHVYPKHVRDFPLPNCNQINKKTIDAVSMPCSYILFLNATEERKTESKDVIEFFDCQIADSLVYELYFHEKFHEDGLYPEPKAYLSELISKHLKPIFCDRWTELHWKRQLNGALTPEEEKELEELEKKNIKAIEGVYDAIANDRATQHQIEKIKSHEWVKVMEGEEK